jgi:rhodanese-related sulfurtransferase
MSRKAFAVFGSLFLLLACLSAAASASAAEPPRITKEELKVRLDDPKIVIVDVRTGRDWTRSNAKIRGAVREEPGNAGGWANQYPKDKLIVLYCA